MGVSLVFHPRNPYVPTVHMNVRFFAAQADGDARGRVVVRRRHGPHALLRLRGGLRPLPPHQPRRAARPSAPEYHPRFKKWCDEYFYLKHRKEPRGIGGIFFDDFNEPGFETSFALMRAWATRSSPPTCPSSSAAATSPYGERERDFQAYRRGRYVEFNLVWDRGTLFGLQSGGRTESILMSLPPVVKWRYDWKPEPGTPEARLYTDFLGPRDWACVIRLALLEGGLRDRRHRDVEESPAARHAQ